MIVVIKAPKAWTVNPAVYARTIIQMDKAFVSTFV